MKAYWKVCQQCGVVHREGYPHRCEPEDWREEERPLHLTSLEEVWWRAGDLAEEVRELFGDTESALEALRRHRPELPIWEWTARDVAVLWANVVIDGGVPPMAAVRMLNLDRDYPVQWPEVGQ